MNRGVVYEEGNIPDRPHLVHMAFCRGIITIICLWKIVPASQI